jgi:hypothetical protein
MSSELETGLEAYPELNQEEDATFGPNDDKPATSEARDWTISTLNDKYNKGQIIISTGICLDQETRTCSTFN